MTATFIVFSYLLAAVGTGGLIVAMLRRARRVAAQVPAEDLPWK